MLELATLQYVEGPKFVVLSGDQTPEGNQMVSTLEATIKAVKEFNAEIIVGIDNTFLSPWILVCMCARIHSYFCTRKQLDSCHRNYGCKHLQCR